METKKWTRGSTEAWLDHFCIWPNRRGQTSCLRSTLCQTHECTSQLTLAMRKTTSAISSRLKKKKTYTKDDSYELVGESDADWYGDVNDRKSTTSYYFKLNGRRSTQLGCQEAGHSCSFFLKQKIRVCQQHFN